MVYSLTVYAVVAAYFFSLMGLEIWGTRRKREKLVWSDALGSLLMGIGSVVLKTLFVGVHAGLYGWVFDRFAPWRLDPASPWVWAGAFVAADLLFYVYHRQHHVVNALWASHVQHHSSEAYNLSTALRQDWTSIPYGIVFWLPLAAVGVPFKVYGAVFGLNLLYQFWIHTRHVGRLHPWIEWVFNTPSHHRVHHAQNPTYQDKNYGGTFIVFDRLFGTFQPELDEEPVVYGVTTPPGSWHPFDAATHVWRVLWRDAVAADRWRDKLALWFMPTGWRPPNLPPHAKTGYPAPYAHTAPKPALAAAYATFGLTVGLFGAYLAHAGAPLAIKLPLAGAVGVAIVCTGWLLEWRDGEVPARE